MGNWCWANLTRTNLTVIVGARMFTAEGAVLLQSAGIARISGLLDPIVLILALVSYMRRREAIGGWLMFFFCTVYLGVLAALLVSIAAVAALYPPQSAPSVSNPPTLGIVTLLRLTGYGGVALVSTYLLQRQEWQWVERLRFAIGANLVLNGICIVLDQIYFPQALVPNLGRWIVMCGWLVYFMVSGRVQTVFRTKTWGQTSARQISA
jgi:hypothetical protein